MGYYGPREYKEDCNRWDITLNQCKEDPYKVNADVFISLWKEWGLRTFLLLMNCCEKGKVTNKIKKIDIKIATLDNQMKKLEKDENFPDDISEKEDETILIFDEWDPPGIKLVNRCNKLIMQKNSLENEKKEILKKTNIISKSDATFMQLNKKYFSNELLRMYYKLGGKQQGLSVIDSLEAKFNGNYKKNIEIFKEENEDQPIIYIRLGRLLDAEKFVGRIVEAGDYYSSKRHHNRLLKRVRERTLVFTLITQFGNRLLIWLEHMWCTNFHYYKDRAEMDYENLKDYDPNIGYEDFEDYEQNLDDNSFGIFTGVE